MFSNKSSNDIRTLALRDSYTDFILSRQAMLCASGTIEFYDHTARKFLLWVESQNVTDPKEITARHVRAFIAQLAQRKLSDSTLNANARAIRTLLKFFYAEGYMPGLTIFPMPKIAKKRLPILSADQVRMVIKACRSKRDKAVILLLVDTGLRRSEMINLNWSDVDMVSGLARVNRGKGGKARSVVLGATTRRALLAYRRLLSSAGDDSPLIQLQRGGRFTGSGILQLFRRIEKVSGIHVTPHALRRTFVILSLQSGMDVLHLQALTGHASLEMVQHYAQMQDEDLVQAHKIYSPIDNLSRLR